MKASLLKEVLEDSYKKNKDITPPPGYDLDKSLSTTRAKVFKSKDSDDVIIAHRGSASKGDWRDNLLYGRFGMTKSTPTYKKAAKVQKEAIDKYGAENITSVGHSRAGMYVQELNTDPKTKVKSVITYNKASGPSDILRKNPKEQTDVRTNKDVVSFLDYFQRHSNEPITIEHDGFNPISAHTMTDLDKLGDQMIGSGVPLYLAFN